MNLAIASSLQSQTAAGRPVPCPDRQDFSQISQLDHEGFRHHQTSWTGRVVVHNLHDQIKDRVLFKVDGRRIGDLDGPIGADRESVASVARLNAHVEHAQRRVIVKIHDRHFRPYQQILVDRGGQ